MVIRRSLCFRGLRRIASHQAATLCAYSQDDIIVFSIVLYYLKARTFQQLSADFFDGKVRYFGICTDGKNALYGPHGYRIIESLNIELFYYSHGRCRTKFCKRLLVGNAPILHADCSTQQ